MGSFWATIAKYAVKLALYASSHPDQVVELVNTLKPSATPQPQPKPQPKP